MPALTDCPMPSEILCLSQVFGLFPVSLSASPGIGVLLRCISVANSVAVLVITFFSLYYAPDIFDTLNAIGLFVDIIQIMAPILTHLVICVEALVRVNDYKKFWFQFGRTFATLQKLNGPLQGELMGVYRRVGLQLGILFVVPLLIEIRILWGIFDNYWVYSRLAAQFSFIGCRLSYLQLCLHLALINWVLQLLANEMQRLSNGSRSQLKSVEWEMTSQVAYRRILLVQQASKDVVELTSHLNQCYRWSLVANLTNNFLSITIAFYWNLRSLYFNNLKYQAESMMVSLPLIIILFTAMFFCENSFKPVTKTVYYLNRMVRHPRNVQLHHLLQHFLLQLLNQRLSLTAMHFFEVNFSSLVDLISAMATYLVIFLQFMPKEGSDAFDNSLIISK